MATKEEKEDPKFKLPKGKRAVVAFEARDNSLHRSELGRDIHDAKNYYNAALQNAADYMAEQAPYVDDWGTKAAAGSDDFKALLEDLMTGFAFEELMRTRESLNSFLKKKAE